MPPQTTLPPFRTARRAWGTSAPTGAKMMAESSSSGGTLGRVPGPFDPQRPGKILGRFVAAPGECVDFPTLVDRDLSGDVGGRAETVDADPLGILAAQAVRAIADQTRAQQRRRRHVVVAGGQREAVALVGRRVPGEATVQGVTGEAGVIAQVLPSHAAKAATAAGPAEPGHPHAIATRNGIHTFTPCHHPADDLVAGDDGQGRGRQLAIHQVEVSAADSAGGDLDQDLARRRPGDGHFTAFEGPPDLCENHGPHFLGNRHRKASG